MSAISVTPVGPLEGSVRLSGAKNSVLKLMAATLLADGTHVLENVPDITDVGIMCELLTAMGAEVRRPAPGRVEITVGSGLVPHAPAELVAEMRASIIVLGPLLARFGEARLDLPGGDDFGGRPIDMHLGGLERMGAEFAASSDVVDGRCEHLVGAEVRLGFPSVGATENLMLAAALAEGRTVIDNAAREPEIADIAAFLNRMGAKVSGAGSARIEVHGVDALESATHSVVPDRIEAATFLAACGIAGGEIVIEGARSGHLTMLIEKLGQMGMRIAPQGDGIWVSAPDRLSAVNISTLPYPGLATDVKPFLVAMLSVAAGTSVVTENLFSGRFRYVAELVEMGADITTEEHHAKVRGVERLTGARVTSHDIRAGACLVAAALGADGPTVVTDAHHIDRGYERFCEKMNGLGARLERVED